MRFSPPILLFVFCTFSFYANSQTLFTFGGKSVSAESFLKAYNKNPEPGNQAKAMEAYLPLYINYHLKVQDAYDKKLDTLSLQKEELDKYRMQLADQFLAPGSLDNSLITEAWERSQKDIRLQHLYIGFNADDTNSQKNATKMAAEAHSALKAGKPFKEVVEKYTTDFENRRSAGELGWVTVFSLPYLYETEIYNLPEGGISAPIKGTGAFHIFKKVATRPAVGKVGVSQIRFQQLELLGGSTAAAKKTADSVYQLLMGGADFATLARQLSNDRSTVGTGGKLTPFGVGQYEDVFQETAFSLTPAKPISQPFQTEFGWHILKLEEKIPVAASLEEALRKGELKNKIAQTDRQTLAKANFIKKQLPKLAYKEASFKKADLWKFTDSALKSKPPVMPNSIKYGTPVLFFGKKSFTADDWVQYVKTIRFSGGPQAGAGYETLFESFALSEAEQYVRSNLEKVDPASSVLLKEYKDANLLFEAMERNVWSKASTDTKALETYYQKHRTKYVWGPSAGALVLSTADSSIVNEGLQTLKNNAPEWRKWVETHPETLVWDSGRYEIEQLPGQKTGPLKQGSITRPNQPTFAEEPFSFAYIFGLYNGGDVRSFEEARGFVTNDYQQVIENEWLARLKKKYPVKINEAVWKSLLKRH